MSKGGRDLSALFEEVIKQSLCLPAFDDSFV